MSAQSDAPLHARRAADGTPVEGDAGAPVPRRMRQVYETIVALTDAFCAEHLNEEYAELARRLTAKLGRKRPSPLAQGQLHSWACAVIYALGKVNFLFDRSQNPHISAAQLCAWFGVSGSNTSAKASLIIRSLRTGPFDARWCLPSRLADNPLVGMIEVNRIPVDARWMPREIQEEAFRLGLIPYVPGPAGPSDADKL